ncbi:MAG: YbdK family carboxylate-amine ligase [Candidatus Microbacterium colombiense]|nr:MAG: YbdK family carboxylate-amine ligase [Microbacterium sp.]
MARFGIEEEFVLLDEQALVPVAIPDAARDDLAARAASGRIMAEYLTCQVECATDPILTRDEGLRQLQHLRGLLGAHAARDGAVVAASGTPFASTRVLAVSTSAHYDAVAEHLAHISRGHEVNGLHVHVEVPDAAERVPAINRVRGWLPTLLALTGNSPFFDGLDSGYASWRSIVIRRLPSSWSPPLFHDLDDYRARVDRLLALEAIGDTASLSWAARISERFPTVEVRVFDAQLHPEETMFAAALCRAIVATTDAAMSSAGVDDIDAALWVAARRGMDARIIDPTTDGVTDAWTAATRLRDAVRPALDELGDLAFVDEHLARIRTGGTGAERQRRAFAEAGLEGLRSLYRRGAPDTGETSHPGAP